MRYCPNCKRDFEDKVMTCAWCEVDTVTELADETTATREKVRRELMPTEEEIASDTAAFFNTEGDTVTIYTAFDPIQAREIEAALKDALIPVLVCEAQPEETTDIIENEATKEVVEEEGTVEENAVIDEITNDENAHNITEEALEDEPKGFFARLFKKKKTPQSDDTTTLATMKYDITRRSVLLDIIVPSELEADAIAILNRTLHIDEEAEVGVYSDDELEASVDNDEENK